ncbi:MAG: NAD-dependent epimerase/dehydratase family protein [Elusimicrobia bacterium]|nr:NAD-dependent epimerase/dehydratase family protein [Elusimicrobiota bacterium]
MGITLVTGAAGFIGSHLTEALIKSGRKVRAFVQTDSRHLDYIRGLGAEIFYGDLLDKESLAKALDGVDEVFHLAANVRPQHWFYSRTGLAREFDKVNNIGTRNLADLSKGKVKTFVYYSSIAAAGVRSLMDETCDALPETEYGASKYDAEQYLLELHKKEGFPVKVVRPGSVYGPRNLNMAMVFKFLKYSIFPFFGKGNNSVPFTYVENLVDATMFVAEKAPYGEKYFVVEDPLTMREFFGGLASGIDGRLSGFYVPMWLIYSGLFVKEALERLFFFRFFPMRMDIRLNTAQVPCSDWICSNEKIKKLGWKPAVGREESLRRTARWYKDNGLV